MVFLLDASQGVSSKDLQLQKNYVKSMAKHFDVAPTGPRASAVAYGTEAQVLANFTDPKFSAKIDTATPLKQPRSMDQALQHAHQLFISNKRLGGRVVLLITAGPQVSNNQTLRNAAQSLHAIGAQIYVVVIGMEPTDKYLDPVVDRTNNIFRINSFKALESQAQTTATLIRNSAGKDLEGISLATSVRAAFRDEFLMHF